MATATRDDGFHEIQLNGKQLVFLFMAITVVSVVIFLCGVLVGRGVRAGTGLSATVAAEPLPVAKPDDAPPAAAPATSDAPATKGEPLTYADRLGDAPPAREKLAPADPLPANRESVPPTREPSPAPAPAAAAPAAAAPPPAPAPAAAVAPGEPAGPGFIIQVAALRERGDADAIANRLISKGYKAYVLAPASGAPAVFRVRVGKFQEKAEADTVAARLQKEEQFKPWIVR